MTDLQRRDFLKISGLGVAGIAVSSALAACGSSKSTPKTSGSSTAKKSSTLRVAMPTDVTSLDPQKQGDIPSMSVAINIFDMLTTRDANNHLVPGLATSWEAVDAKTWRFTIRDGVTFHNGEACDAAAVAFSINRLLDPKTKSPIVELSHVKSAKAVDAKTVDFVMKDADPILPEKVSLFGGVIVPPKYLAQVGDAGFADRPIGTGPYKFVSRAQDQNITLQANENYWGTKAAIPNVKILIMPSAASSIAALQAGEVDIVTSLTPDAAKQLGAGSHAHVKITPGVREYYVAMNTLDGGPLANVDVRKALNYAVDVPTLIHTLLAGGADQTPTLLPQQVFGYDPSITGFTFDLDKAKSLLAGAGYANGFSLQITTPKTTQSVAEAIAGQLSKVGVKLSVRTMDAAAFKALLVSGNPKAIGPMYLSGNTGWTLDGESFLQSTIRSNRRQSLWHNKDADKLIDKEETSLVATERQSAFKDLQQLLADNAPFIYLYHAANVYAVRNGVNWTIPLNGTLAMASASFS